MVEFNNEEMQGERRETFVIQADRFGEDSALNSVREKLRPLLKRGFAGFAEKRMTQCGTLNPYVYRASLVRATAILGGHLVWNQGEDWLVSEERQTFTEGNFAGRYGLAGCFVILYDDV